MARAPRTRIGFIGAGWWSTTYYMPLLHRRKDVELVGVCGLDPAVLGRCQRDFGFAQVTSDHRRLLEWGLDGVIIGSPHGLHGAQAVAALRAGCHVLVEKPMTTDARSAREIVRLAARGRRHVIVPCGWQYRPIGTRAKELMDRGIVGEVEFVVCHMASPLRSLMTGTSFDFAAGAYVTANLSTWSDPRVSHGGYGQGQLPHSIGLMLWLTGLEPRSVFARMSQPSARVDLYDAISVAYRGGAIGTISGSATLPPGTPGDFQLDVRIFGSRGMLHLDVSRDHLSWRSGKGPHRVEPLPKGAGSYENSAAVLQFVDLIRGRTRRNNSPASVGCHAVEILDAAYRSARSGRDEKV